MKLAGFLLAAVAAVFMLSSEVQAESGSMRKLIAKRKAHAHKIQSHQDKEESTKDEKKTKKKDKKKKKKKESPKSDMKKVKIIGVHVDLPVPGSPAALAAEAAETSNRQPVRVLGGEQTPAPSCECAYHAGPAIIEDAMESDYVAPLMAPCSCDANGARVIDNNWVDAVDVSLPDPESIAAASAIVNDDGTINPQYNEAAPVPEGMIAPVTLDANDDEEKEEVEELGPEYISNYVTPEMKVEEYEEEATVPPKEQTNERLMASPAVDTEFPWVPQYKDEMQASEQTMSQAHNNVAENIKNQQLETINALNPDHTLEEAEIHDSLDDDVAVEAETI